MTPLRAYTRLIRVVAGVPLPRRLRGPVFGRIAGRMGIDMTEAEQQVSDYRSFGELFIRRLQRDRRPVEDGDDVLVAPVDGSVSAFGHARRGELIQAKGIDYRLEELIESESLAEELQGGSYVTIYLQPRDYHRIHCPAACRVVGLRRIAGTLFPVKPYMVRNLKNLFTRNERVVLELQTEVGRVAMICVAAAGVGNITTVFDSDPGLRGAVPSDLEKGAELAAFNLGSTVILVFPPGKVELEPLSVGQPIRMGQRLARQLGQGRR